MAQRTKATNLFVVAENPWRREWTGIFLEQVGGREILSRLPIIVIRVWVLGALAASLHLLLTDERGLVRTLGRVRGRVQVTVVVNNFGLKTKNILLFRDIYYTKYYGLIFVLFFFRSVVDYKWPLGRKKDLGGKMKKRGRNTGENYIKKQGKGIFWGYKLKKHFAGREGCVPPSPPAVGRRGDDRNAQYITQLSYKI